MSIKQVFAITILILTTIILRSQDNRENEIYEEFALNSNRSEVLKKLIPGTEIYFFLNTLYLQQMNARKYGLDENVKVFKGVILGKIERNGAAANAGLQEGDIITKINTVEINSESAFEEELAYRYPGDKITITYLRNNKVSTASLTLLNKKGDTNVTKRVIFTDATLGASMEAVDYGVKVFNIKDGLLKRIQIPENYTIIQINRKQVKDPGDVIEFFNNYKGRVYLYGINGLKQEMQLSFYLQ